MNYRLFDSSLWGTCKIVVKLNGMAVDNKARSERVSGAVK